MLFMSRVENVNKAIPVPFNSSIDVFDQVINQIHKVDTELKKPWNMYTVFAILGKSAERLNTHYGHRSVKDAYRWRVIYNKCKLILENAGMLQPFHSYKGDTSDTTGITIYRVPLFNDKTTFQFTDTVFAKADMVRIVYNNKVYSDILVHGKTLVEFSQELDVEIYKIVRAIVQSKAYGKHGVYRNQVLSLNVLKCVNDHLGERQALVAGADYHVADLFAAYNVYEYADSYHANEIKN